MGKNQAESPHKNRACRKNMVTKIFTDTTKKGRRITQFKKYIKQLFYSRPTYTGDINVTEMMVGKQWVKR